MTTAVHTPGSLFVVMFAGQVIEGGCVSSTVTVNEQFAVWLEVSVAVQVTVVVPFAKVEPEAGTHAVTTPGQLSVAVAVNVTTAVHTPGAAGVEMFAGQVMTGFSLSLIVTVKVHVLVLLEASVAVQVTVVTPFGNEVPDAGTHAAVGPGQLSVGVGVVYVTVAEHNPGAVLLVMLLGHVIAGG